MGNLLLHVLGDILVLPDYLLNMAFPFLIHQNVGFRKSENHMDSSSNITFHFVIEYLNNDFTADQMIPAGLSKSLREIIHRWVFILSSSYPRAHLHDSCLTGI